MISEVSQIIQLVVLCLLMVGCSTVPPERTFDFNDFSVKVARPDIVDAACVHSGSLDDYGRPLTHVAACWDGLARTMWIDWNRPDTLLHEMCHMDGSDPEDCANDYNFYGEYGEVPRWMER